MAKVDNSHTSTLVGTGGADILDGRFLIDQHDELFGLQGDDVFRIDWFAGQTDTVIENANGGIDVVELYVPQNGPAIYELADNVENLRIIGGTDASVWGNALANIIDDNDNSHEIVGGAGDDTINGNGGSDLLYGGAGKDVINAGLIKDDGNSSLFGDDGTMLGYVQGGNDTLNGNSYIDTNGSSQSNDQLFGDTRTLFAGMAGGDDVLNAGGGADLLVGDATQIEYGGRGGNDLLNGDPANAPAGPFGQSSADWLMGDAYDHLYGRGGNDTLNGGNGNDTLYGDAGGFINGGFGGNDLLNGGVGDDLLVGDGFKLEAVFQNGSRFGGIGGSDTLNGDAGNDRLYGDVWSYLWDGAVGGNDILNGGDGDDRLAGDGWQLYTPGSRGGDDRLDGGAGNDVLYGDARQVEGLGGADRLAGGDGNDLLYGDGATGGSLDAGGNDTLDGGNGDDWLYGNGGNDSLAGGAGSDLLDGGAGNDRLEGGAGDDVYLKVETGDQPIIEAANGGNDTVLALARSYTLAANVENLVLLSGEPGPRLGVGNALANHLTGSDVADRLQGLDGDDTLDGGEAGDTLEGGAGNDVYVVDSRSDVVIESVGAGTDTVFAALGTYVLTANVENLTFTVGIGSNQLSAFGRGNALNNVIVANDGNDTLIGDGGDDTLRGGRGADLMIGGAGNDTYFVDRQLTASFDDVVEKPNDGIDVVRVAGPLDNYAFGTFFLAPDVENVVAELNAGAAPLTLVGNALANTIDGKEAANVLVGGAGNDTMRGGLGDDTYFVQDVGDSLSENANAGVDTVRLFVAPATIAGFSLGANLEKLAIAGIGALNATGNGLDNELAGNGAANRLDGGAGNDTLLGGRGNDILLGGEGKDTLDGGPGNDSMIGGNGDDLYVVDSALDSVSESATGGVDIIRAFVSFDMSSDGADADSIADGLNVENLTLLGFARIGKGNALDNVILGNERTNFLFGLGGNDVIDGGAANDTMDGGAGNDTYRVDSSGDVVVEALNGGIDLVISTAFDFTLGDNVDNLTLGNVGGGAATGNALANTLIGNDAANTLRGLGGDDKLSGAGENDRLYGGSGNDTLNGDGGDDSLYGDADADILRGGDGSDRADGGAGDDRLYGDAGNDFLAGDLRSGMLATAAGNDRLEGGDGNDSLFGDSDETLAVRGGNDTLIGGNGNDVLLGDGLAFVQGGSGGNDVLNGGDGNDTLYGDVFNPDAAEGGDDTLNGDAGDDLLYGGAGNDKLNGGTGNDWLYGGAGNDTMTGGDGNDTYFVDASGDKVIEAATATAGSADIVVSSISFDLGASAANVENLTGLQGPNAMVLKGNAGNNVISLLTNSTANATMEGLAGDDRYDIIRLMDGQTATDTAGNDTLRATVFAGTDAEPIFTGIENITFDLSGGVSSIDGRSISIDAQHTQSTDTSANSLTLEGVATELTLNAMRAFTAGITLREFAGAVTYSSLNAGAVRFALDHADVGLSVGQNTSRVFLDVIGDGSLNELDANSLAAPLTLTSTGGILQVNALNFNQTALTLQDYMGSLGMDNAVGANGNASIETRGAHVELKTNGSLAHLLLTTTGTESALNLAQGGYTDITLLQASTAAVTLTHLHQDIIATQFTQSLTALFDEGGHLVQTGSGDTRIVLVDGNDQLIYLTNQFGAGDSVTDSSHTDHDNLFIGYNGAGTLAVPVELHADGIETFNIASNSGTSFLSLADVRGAQLVRIGTANGAIVNIADVSADVTVSGSPAIVDFGAGDWKGSGSVGADTFNGGVGDNFIAGDALNDDLAVNGGNDILRGGAGVDRLWGDTFHDLAGNVHGGDDQLFGDAGNDEIVGDSMNFSGAAVAGNDVLFGGEGDDTLYADFGGNFGAPTSRTGQNTLIGGDGNDTLIAGSVADDVTIDGSAAGSDRFVFDTPLGNDNVDTLVFFNTHNDVIVLSQQIFSAITPNGNNLPDAAFWADANPLATELATSRILLETTTGKLYYDADGSGTTASAVQFAVFNDPVGGLNGLTAADFQFDIAT